MIFAMILVYGLVMFFLYNRFMRALGTADITWTDEDTGEETTEERYILTNQAMVQVLIAIIWTGFSFWLVGKQMIEYFYYY